MGYKLVITEFDVNDRMAPGDDCACATGWSPIMGGPIST